MISVIPESSFVPVNSDIVSSQKSIFVCTFCQVFASSVSSVANHINSEHKDSLLHGTTAENYISQLKSLPGGDKEKSGRKLGRPRKSECKSEPVEEKQTSEPVPGAHGLYWCETCGRHFKKPRQLVRHNCFTDEEDDLDQLRNSEEFKPNKTIDIPPWQRLPKICRKDNQQNQRSNKIDRENVYLEEHDKVVSAEKRVLSLLPLFNSEKEKLDFEKHLKSIDYTFVDFLFEKKEKSHAEGIKSQGCRSIYICTVCKKIYHNVTHIRMHCLIHTDIKPFTCPRCPYETNSLGTLYSHMRKHTGNVFCCSKCPFKTSKRAHLLDHEDTHSNVTVLCKLCKNSYKTVRSLIAHVNKYHKSKGGKKYLELLRSKDPKEISLSCQNALTGSKSSVDKHNQSINETSLSNQEIDKAVEHYQDSNLEETLNGSSIHPSKQNEPEALPIKDPLADIILQTILEEKNSEGIALYDKVFKEEKELLGPSISPEAFSSDITILPKPENNSSQFDPSEAVLKECTKTLEIIGECLNKSNYNSNISIHPSLPEECNDTFHMEKLPMSFPSDPEIQKTDGISSELNTVTELGESYPAENKLFEKCHRAPAYVCCVCSGIYICPSTLKAHLREHINTTESFIERAAQDFEEMVDDPNLSTLEDSDLILEDQSDVCVPADEKELEKLYISSLDMMWYLPEVSVVLDHDPALFDSILEDFPDRLDDPEMLDQVH